MGPLHVSHQLLKPGGTLVHLYVNLHFYADSSYDVPRKSGERSLGRAGDWLRKKRVYSVGKFVELGALGCPKRDVIIGNYIRELRTVVQ